MALQEADEANLSFADFELDRRTGVLRRQGVRIRLRAKPLEILLALMEKPGRIVSRAQLISLLWPGDSVLGTDNNLNAVVARLRHSLRDSATRPRFIETLPKRGYRFIHPLR